MIVIAQIIMKITPQLIASVSQMLYLIPFLLALLPFGSGANVTLTDGRIVSVSAVPLYYKGISLFNSLKY